MGQQVRALLLLQRLCCRGCLPVSAGTLKSYHPISGELGPGEWFSPHCRLKLGVSLYYMRHNGTAFSWSTNLCGGLSVLRNALSDRQHAHDLWALTDHREQSKLQNPVLRLPWALQ